MNDHKAAAADITGARISHRHGKADRNGGIDRIAALPQYLGADTRCDRFLRDDHAVVGGDGLRVKYCWLGATRARPNQPQRESAAQR
jgi:hypothetical protein